MSKSTPREALTRAIDLLDGQAAVARETEVTPGAVWQWLQNGLPVSPQNRVLQLEALCIERLGLERVIELELTRHHFRPDIYPSVSEVVA